MEVHSIRLRGPWEYQVLARSTDDEVGSFDAVLPSGELPAGKVHMPCDWGESLGADFRGTVCYTRRFGCPTGVETHQRVWLILDGVRDRASVCLNGQPLGDIIESTQPLEVDVTGLLNERNMLEVEVSAPVDPAELPIPTDSLPGGLVGEVRLEIRG
ncbi:MAG: hypothetical protein SGJ20_08140 [Planctomycetota bacterium]|nr:hypothetical protein [Planctomycetota bacterium]